MEPLEQLRPLDTRSHVLIQKLNEMIDRINYLTRSIEEGGDHMFSTKPPDNNG